MTWRVFKSARLYLAGGGNFFDKNDLAALDTMLAGAYTRPPLS